MLHRKQAKPRLKEIAAAGSFWVQAGLSCFHVDRASGSPAWCLSAFEFSAPLKVVISVVAKPLNGIINVTIGLSCQSPMIHARGYDLIASGGAVWTGVMERVDLC